MCCPLRKLAQESRNSFTSYHAVKRLISIINPNNEELLPKTILLLIESLTYDKSCVFKVFLFLAVPVIQGWTVLQKRLQ